ncbi:MAG: hypothetical protein WBX02_13795, partial [Terriglobales bacterium]
AFWRTRLLPLLLLMYATLGGTTLSLTIRELREEVAPGFLHNLEYGLLVVNFVLLAGYLARMNRSFPAARATLRQLLSGPYARVFFWLGSAGRTICDSAALYTSEPPAHDLARRNHSRL